MQAFLAPPRERHRRRRGQNSHEGQLLRHTSRPRRRYQLHSEEESRANDRQKRWRTAIQNQKQDDVRLRQSCRIRPPLACLVLRTCVLARETGRILRADSQAHRFRGPSLERQHGEDPGYPVT